MPSFAIALRIFPIAFSVTVMPFADAVAVVFSVAVVIMNLGNEQGALSNEQAQGRSLRIAHCPPLSATSLRQRPASQLPASSSSRQSPRGSHLPPALNNGSSPEAA